VQYYYFPYILSIKKGIENSFGIKIASMSIMDYDLENYERFLGELNSSDGGHWEKLQKRTATLFQVLMDGDLKELVFVLKHYPKYIEIVCEHFRYLYNYSETVADIYAASTLLEISTQYHQKQFVRNLLRKLEKVDEFNSGELKKFLENLIANQEKIHPIIIAYYKHQLALKIQNSDFHKLQMIVLEKNLQKLQGDDSFDFSASDRDANLDIPYMN
jgi:hypothetical protein